MSTLSIIKNVISIERDALDFLISKLNKKTDLAVDYLYACKGKVVFLGVGKAGIIAQKIAATFSSTGTPATYINPSEAFHGDLGFITNEDLVVFTSNSGNTDEIVRLLPHFKRLKTKTIALTGNTRSPLAQHCDIVIDVGVQKEADTLNMAPTASTTALLAMGDALAVCLMVKKGITKRDYSLSHPGGVLGKKMLLRVEDIMHKKSSIPIVFESTPVKDSIFEMTHKRLGVVFVCNNEHDLIGVFTDGDLRRLLQRNESSIDLTIQDVMKTKPIVVQHGTLAADAINLMEKHAVTVLPVINDTKRLVGVVHIHDIIKSGIV